MQNGCNFDGGFQNCVWLAYNKIVNETEECLFLYINISVVAHLRSVSAIKINCPKSVFVDERLFFVFSNSTFNAVNLLVNERSVNDQLHENRQDRLSIRVHARDHDYVHVYVLKVVVVISMAKSVKIIHEH